MDILFSINAKNLNKETYGKFRSTYCKGWLGQEHHGTMNEMFSKLKSSTFDHSLTLNWEGCIQDIEK